MVLDSDFEKWLSNTRREFHSYPETLFKEVNTTEKIKSILSEMDIEHRGYDDMTGVVGIIYGKQPGKTIGLRADIDALPIEELNDVPYKSVNPGTMHACGHDAHITIMLGVAKYVKESGLYRQLKGSIKFIFQPAEEGGAGAKEMIERGVLEDPRVDCIVACHMGPDLPVGEVGVYMGKSHASADRFRLVIRGKGGHGARPDQTIDPIVAGAHFVTALQTAVSRNTAPQDAGVISVGRFSAGSAGNVIPEDAELEGTIRALFGPVRELLHKRIREIVNGIETAFGVRCELDLKKGYPVCVSDKNVAEFIYNISSDLFGTEKVRTLPPSTGSEDFAYFCDARPGTLIRLGCGNASKGIVHPLHSAYFDLDEAVLGIGVNIFAEAVRRSLI